MPTSNAERIRAHSNIFRTKSLQANDLKAFSILAEREGFELRTAQINVPGIVAAACKATEPFIKLVAQRTQFYLN